MAYAVVEKDLATEEIVTVAEFASLADAEDYAEEMMTLYIEERAYKILPVEPLV